MPLTDARQAKYTNDVVLAVRSVNIYALQEMIDSNPKDTPLDACNAQGGTLLHIACRRGSLALVKLLVEQGHVSPRCRDIYGKTPLHDVCWSRQPNFQVFRYLIQQSPELLFVKDERGHSPLQYVPQACSHEWVTFLKDYHTFLRMTVQMLSFAQARQTLAANHERLHTMLYQFTKDYKDTTK